MREGKGVELDYEGMGACIEAYLFVDGKRVCTIGAASPEMNDKTSRVVAAAKAELTKIWEEETGKKSVRGRSIELDGPPLTAGAVKVGAKVKWVSQSGGFSKVKEGVIAQILKAKEMPSRELFPTLYKHSGVGGSRDHESYVVKVGSRPYWPRANHLRRL